MSQEPGVHQPWPWPDELDALIAAPAFHENLFENDLVRYLEVIIRPGDFVPVHTHRWPSVIYVRSTSDFIRRDGEWPCRIRFAQGRSALKNTGHRMGRTVAAPFHRKCRHFGSTPAYR